MSTKRLPFVLLGLASASFAAYACGDDPGVDGGGTPDASTEDASVDAGGGDAVADAGDGGPARCVDYAPLKRPLFGDLHSHTSYSGDAYTFDTRNTPLDAYAFARGKTLQIAGAGAGGGGPMTTIDRPLDFLAVTDHSEFLAAAYGCGADLAGAPYDPTKQIFDTNVCKAFRSDRNSLQLLALFAVMNNVCDGGTDCTPLVTSAWQKEQQAAAAAYEPCKFTSFVAYEWTKTEDGKTLHKNVVFANDKVPARPFDSLTYPTQEQLWSALAAGCGTAGGCEAVTIPHNSNISQGLAFEVPAGATDRANMIRFQKLVEIFQHKGASECISDDGSDPDCAFEQLPDAVDVARDKPAYVRDALKKGLVLQSTTGQNPLAFGIVGATDDHNGTPGNVRESTFPGHVGSNDDTPAKRIGGDAGEVRSFNPGGITVAWAEENTRASIFAAFQRRETYATSGPRMVVRFYETTDATNACADPDFPKALVEKGAIPMGGVFKPGAASPQFVVRAWKDATALARIDIVKAWVDGTGTAKEKVVSRALDASSAGAACITWQDDEATPGPALYYARVLEAPTPRWSSNDCDKAPGANPTDCAVGGALRVNIQERAWTSPIWRTP
ncbi:MAG: DUF3604 domain-containing protein [Deltaproteobacteria bacterium]|nr:DUF3604 domain-containing protein [Deltaproteobacteria bacterium]